MKGVDLVDECFQCDDGCFHDVCFLGCIVLVVLCLGKAQCNATKLVCFRSCEHCKASTWDKWQCSALAVYGARISYALGVCEDCIKRSSLGEKCFSVGDSFRKFGLSQFNPCYFEGCCHVLFVRFVVRFALLQNSDSKSSAISSSCQPSFKAWMILSFSRATCGSMKSIAQRLKNSFLVMVCLCLVVGCRCLVHWQRKRL